ncbi:sphingomyelin synthase, partial [Perkinsus olseni]
MGGTRATCGDVLFSGHAANITIMALIWNEYCRHFLPPRAYVTVRSTGMWNAKRRTGFNRDYLACAAWLLGYFVPKVLCPILAVAGYLVVIATHFHYTVDVLVGIFVAWKMWRVYHMYVRSPKLLLKAPLLRWFEERTVADLLEAKSELRRIRSRRKRTVLGIDDGGASTSTAATASDNGASGNVHGSAPDLHSLRSLIALSQIPWSYDGTSVGLV